MRQAQQLSEALAGVAWRLAASLLILSGCGGSAPRIDRDRPYVDLVDEIPEQIVSTGVASSEPRFDTERGTIWLPVSTQIDYLIKLAPDSAFEATDIVIRGGETRLEVDLEADGMGVANLAFVNESQPNLSIPISLNGDPPVRLVLRARSTDSADDGGVLIRNPGVWASTEAVISNSEKGSDLTASTQEAGSTQPSVLIYLIDTLRSDRLGCYGYDRNISPNIDRFASGATLFEHVTSQSSWTKASVGSMFTGMWPPAHGAIGWKHKLPTQLETLAEVLSRAGFQTGGFSANPNVVPAYDMDQGFDEFHRLLRRTSAQLNEIALEWLDRQDPDRPFLLYIHTIDPHAPYQPPEPFRSQWAPNADQMPSWQPSWKWPMEAMPFLSNLYDGEIAFSDHSFGQLLAELRARDRFDNSFVVLISDHGEEFKEHGRWRHGGNLYAESLEVPMIVKSPGQVKGQRVTVPAQHIDLMPTLLEQMNLPIPVTVEGQSLARPEPKRIYSHLKLGKSPLFYSVIDGDWKMIRMQTAEATTRSLFNRRTDPGETEDLWNQNPIRGAWMERLIDKKIAASAEPPPASDATVDPELEEALGALGYLE